jgi:hypothetical protein
VSEAQVGWGGSLSRALRFFGPGRLILTVAAAGAAGAALFIASQAPALAAILGAAAIVLTILTLANPIQTALTMSGAELRPRLDSIEEGFSTRAANLESGLKIHGEWIGRVEEMTRASYEIATRAHDHVAGSTAAVHQIATVLVDANLAQRMEVLEASRVAGDVGKTLRDLELRLTFLEQEPIEQVAEASSRRKKG